MGAIRSRAWSLLRRRLVATVVLVLLVGLAGAVVLAAVAGARRGDRALPAFLATQRPPDAVVYVADESQGGTGSATREVEMRTLDRLPYVERAMRAAPLVIAGPDVPDGPGRAQLALITLDRGAADVLGRPIVVDGRRPDEARADEVAVDEELVERSGVGVGGTYPASLFTAEQVGVALDGDVPPAGPDVDLRVVGVVRYPHDLVPAETEQDSAYLDHADVYPTPGFWERYGPDLANFGLGVGVHLEHGRADVERLRADARRLFGDATSVDDIDPERGVSSIPLDGVRRAIDLETRALQGFAAIVALAAVLLVGQALARQVQVEAADDVLLRAVGMTRAQLVGAAVLRGAVVAGTSAVVAVAGAVALSPLTPVGIARRAEVSPGLDVDVPVLALGAVALVAAVCARVAVAAWRSARVHAQAGGVAAPVLRGRLARSPLPVSGWTGLALALQRGRGGLATLLRAAVAAAAVTVVAITAAIGFGASLDGLDDDPERYGVTWDVSVANAASPEDAAAAADSLRDNPDVGAYAGLTSEDLLVGPEGVAVSALVVFEGRGRIPPQVVEGRPPEAPSEIAFGGETLRELGAAVGDEVEVRLQDFEPQRFRVSGRVVLNSATVDDEIDSGDGGILTSAGQQRLVPAEVAALSQPQSFVVRLAPTADETRAVARLSRDFSETLLRPLPPSGVANVLRVSGLPALLAGVVAVLGTGTTAHAMVSTVRRRRRELAVLSGLGFVRRQVAASLAWVATAFAVVALVVGLPVGVALGRWAWRLTADALWVVAPAEVPVWPLVVVPVVTLVVVNATALAARSVSGRGAPARALRTE